MIPPGVWLLFLSYSQIFNFSEIVSIVLSLPMISYILFATAGVMYIFNTELVHIEEAVQKQSSSEASEKALSRLPIWLLIAQILYSTMGPIVVLAGRDSITSEQYWLSQLMGIPLVLLFIIPIFILFVINLETYTKNLDLSSRYPWNRSYCRASSSY